MHLLTAPPSAPPRGQALESLEKRGGRSAAAAVSPGDKGGEEGRKASPAAEGKGDEDREDEPSP